MGNKFDVNKVNSFYSWNFDENSYLLWDFVKKKKLSIMGCDAAKHTWWMCILFFSWKGNVYTFFRSLHLIEYVPISLFYNYF